MNRLDPTTVLRSHSQRLSSIALMSAVLVIGVASLSACGSDSAAGATDANAQNVNIVLTNDGCVPSPATISSGPVVFHVTNQSASKVSEAELRSSDLAHIYGEKENLVPGLSGKFSLNIGGGSYVIECEGAKTSEYKFTVTGPSTAASWTTDPKLSAAVTGYTTYVQQQVVSLLSGTTAMCTAIANGDLAKAQELYSPARLPYERIEPVAEAFGDLDTHIDGRWENPVTVKSQFIGFHRIEQLMFQDKTLTGAPALCTGLLANEKKLQSLVADLKYSPLEMASGATDLLNEAATAKISGEEERYSNVDLPTFRANIDGANDVVALLTPSLKEKDPTLLATINQRHDAVLTALQPYVSTPGYLSTGYVNYDTVTTNQRKGLSAAVNAYAEALSGMSSQVS
jgi:iron uptake system component EfeO